MLADDVSRYVRSALSGDFVGLDHHSPGDGVCGSGLGVAGTAWQGVVQQDAASRTRRSEMAAGTLELSAGTPADVTLARHAVEVRLLEWGCGHLEDVLLVFSELVTNAVSHANRAERVQVRLDEAAVTVVVYDLSPLSPRMRAVRLGAGRRVR